MSIAIPRAGLTRVQEEFISKYLTIVPVNDDYLAKKMKFKPKTTDGTVQFWKAEKDYVHVPLLFGSGAFKIYPDPSKYPQSPMKFTGKLLERQIQPVQEAWTQLQTHGTTTLSLPTGFGKTIIGAYLASGIGKITLVVVSLSSVIPNWIEAFKKNTSARIWVVGDEAMSTTGVDVIISMDQRVEKIPKEVLNQVGTLIADEAHLLCTPGKKGMWLAVHPCYVIIETATLERDDGMHLMITSIAGEHAIYRQSNTPFKVYKVKTNTAPKGNVKNPDGSLNWHSLEADITSNPRRLQIVYQMVTHAYPDDAVLIVTRHVQHAKTIAAGLRTLKVDAQEYHSDMKNYQDCRVLVGTVQKIGTGFDQPATAVGWGEHSKRFRVLIIASSIKKKTQVVQVIGRVFRADNPVVVHLVDNHPTYLRHIREAVKIYKSRHGVVEEVNIPNVNGE